MIVSLVEFVLSKDAMKDRESVIHVRYTFKEVQQWRNEGHMSCKKKLIVGEYRREPARDEEKQLNYL